MVRWHDDWRGEWRLDWRGEEPSNAVSGYGNEPVATFVLDLENGFTVKHDWGFDLQKFQSGKEKRISRNDAPQESFSGSAILLDNEIRSTQAQLAQYAATGAQFGLALPHEMLEVVDVSGAMVTVNADELALTDWTKEGQRCVVCYLDDENRVVSSNAIIQDVSGAVITLDISPNVDVHIIMPVRPIFLEPQQTIARYPTEAAVWQLAARAAVFDFAPTLATLDMATQHVSLAGNVVKSRVFGAAGNSHFELRVDNAYPATGQLVESNGYTTVLAKTNVTTMDDVDTLLAGSGLVRLTQVNAAYVIQAADAFNTVLSGGAVAGDVGNGVTLTTYDGDGSARPVWDRPLTVDTTAADSIQAMTHIIEHGALAYAVSTADKPDFGRAIAVGSGNRYTWQWLKKFLSTTIGAQNIFWLATWADDLTYVSYSPIDLEVAELVVEADDVASWFPSLREHIQLVNDDETAAYVKIYSAVDNGDGTWTLTIDRNDDIASVRLISWLEPCRFSSDSLEFKFGPRGVTLTTVGRVVVDLGSTRRPREFAVISYGTTTHLMSFADRDMVIGGSVYTAVAGARGRVGVPSSGSPKETSITLPIDHPFVTRYFQKGIPPGKIAATITRLEADSSLEQIWTGEIDGVSVDDECVEATFRVVSLAGRIGLRVIPSFVISRTCQHTLFEGMCARGISRDGSNPDAIPYKLTTTVLAIDGRDVRINLTNVPASDPRRAQWCLLGEIVHTASGERRTIRDQQDVNPGTGTLTQLTLHVPIVELKVGDSIDVYPGCDKTINGTHGCSPKFGNRHNFGGFPQLPSANPFIPGNPGAEGL